MQRLSDEEPIKPVVSGARLRRLGGWLSYEKQLLAEEKFLVESVKKVNKERNDLKAEYQRLQKAEDQIDEAALGALSEPMHPYQPIAYAELDLSNLEENYPSLTPEMVDVVRKIENKLTELHRRAQKLEEKNQHQKKLLQRFELIESKLKEYEDLSRRSEDRKKYTQGDAFLT